MHIECYQNFLVKQKQSERLRSLPEALSGINLDFSTNDYLGLSKHPDIKKSILLALEDYNVGATGSRLLSGNHRLNALLEEVIAKDKNMEKALYFPTGFQANFSCLQALLDPKILKNKPFVYFDKRNHNSLYQALLGLDIELHRYTNLSQLETLLSAHASQNMPKFLVTESVFGMDGDIVDIKKIKELAEAFQLFVFLDEAHATGVVGQNGLGLSKEVSWEGIDILIMGTFSKALGVMGAYVASKATVIDYLVNKASGFLYSTASSPLIVAACHTAWQLNKSLNDKRVALLELSAYARKKLQSYHFKISNDLTPILPIIVGQETKALELKQRLISKGILVSAIRHPTVPHNQARIRLALTAEHTRQDIDKLMEALLW